MNPILIRLNEIMTNPSLNILKDSFDESGFIRFNMIHISPITLNHFKSKLHSFGLVRWFFKENGLEFQFNNFILFFKGNLSVTLCPFHKETSNRQIHQSKINQSQKEEQDFGNRNSQSKKFPKFYCIELDFEPFITPQMIYILAEIETYLKSADSVFFMSYYINTDYEILSKSLTSSLGMINQRIMKKKQEREN